MAAIRTLTIVLLVSALCVAANRALADDDKKPDAAAGGAMIAEQMQKLAAPAAEHEALKPMVGTFNAQVTSAAMDGSGKMESSKGVMTNELVLDGRFLQSRYDGSDMKGIGYLGYDNAKKKYVATWMDTMSTMIMVMEGSADASGKVITTTTQMNDPTSGKPVSLRCVTTVIDQDKHTYEMFMPGADGKEMKILSIVYTRAK
jgi:hypothetical protein